MATTFINSSLEDVKFHIENQSFEGPIDLLVSMVKEAKIDIMEIFVSDITRQYIAYVKTLKELDYEYVSQYIILAATLIEIKSGKLLPIQEEYDDYQEEVNLMEKQLISDLEKRLLLELPEKLRPRETLNLFYPEPEYDENDYKLIAKNLTLEQLLGAYQLILEKAVMEESAKIPKTITMERFTVAEQVKDIAYKVRTQKEIRFYDLFLADYTRQEIINVFLAILEIVKKQIALATQAENNDIVLKHNVEDKFDIEHYNEEELTKDVEEYN